MRIVIAALLAATWLHPFHISQAEVEWNPQSQRVEVALRLHPQDAQAIIDRMARTTVDLGTAKDEDLKEWYSAYLRERFALVLESAKDEPPVRGEFEWVGVERGERHVWLYFELKRPSALSEQPVLLENRVLMDIQADQTNVVLLRGLERVGLQFRDEQIRLPLPPAFWEAKGASTPDTAPEPATGR
jgi:hypothetical protein